MMSSGAKIDWSNLVIQLAGDSGDGMQHLGQVLAEYAASNHFQILTAVDFPSEIRAPKDTTAGVSGFQILIHSNKQSLAMRESCDVLLAMNPASLIKYTSRLHANSIIIIDSDRFTSKSLKKTQIDNVEYQTLRKSYNFLDLSATTACLQALAKSDFSKTESDRARNYFMLGALAHLLQLPSESGLQLIARKFINKTRSARSNSIAFREGWQSLEGIALPERPEFEKKQTFEAGTYRNITGNQSLALGLIAAGLSSQRGLFYGSYPITPASEILQEITKTEHPLVKTHQAEDEIAAIGSAIGASFGGWIAATASSGPGISLKSEFLGLAVMSELLLVVIDVQRAGPSTGMPTKTSQGDLLQSMFGRHGDCPAIVLAMSSPAEGFAMAYEAVSLAVKYMTPVIILSDASLAFGSEIWKIPQPQELPEIQATEFAEHESFQPFTRDPTTGSRPWKVPGDADAMHCLGGLEKQPVTGSVSHQSEDHMQMTKERRDKLMAARQDFSRTVVDGSKDAKILVLSWGSTCAVIKEAIAQMEEDQRFIAHLHLKYIFPLASDLEDLINSYKNRVVFEINEGQLVQHLRASYETHFVSRASPLGRSFTISEIQSAIQEELASL